MNRTKIEWTDYTWNPVTGCLNNCSYCYARKIAERFRGSKAWPRGFEPTFRTGRLLEPFLITEPSKIFVCSMGELFGDWCYNNYGYSWASYVIGRCRYSPQHIFQFLTKCPQNLAKWNPWPENAWVGVTATDFEMSFEALYQLTKVEAKVKYLSIEPLLNLVFHPCPVEPINLKKYIDWIIIGAQTGAGAIRPHDEWVQGIIDAADRGGVPVFLKDNLRWPEQRRDWPKKAECQT